MGIKEKKIRIEKFWRYICNNSYVVIICSNIVKDNQNTESNIKFFTEAVGGDPTEKMSIHSDGMMSLRQHGTAKTYFFSSFSDP